MKIQNEDVKVEQVAEISAKVKEHKSYSLEDLFKKFNTKEKGKENNEQIRRIN